MEKKPEYTKEELEEIRQRMEKEFLESEKNAPRMAPFFRKASSQRLYEEGRRKR